MTSVYVEVLAQPFRPMINVKGMLINIIDAWEIPESEQIKYPDEKEMHFVDFLI